MNNEKNALRKALKNVLIENRAEKSRKICEKIATLPCFTEASKVFSFMPSDSEPDISPLNKSALEGGKRVFVPVTTDVIRFAEIDINTAFQSKKFGISEPVSPAFFDGLPKSRDVMLVPMVAFDSKMGRLGHGKGYYDRFLENKSVIKIGVAFSAFEVESVLNEFHDIKMDIIVTEDEIYENNCGKI